MRSRLQIGRLRTIRRQTIAAAVITAALTASSLVPTAAAPSRASTTSFYVACRTGKAAGSGSAKHPWTSLTSVSRHRAFLPGQKVLLKRGKTCRGSVTVHGSGRPTARILLGAYGKGPKPIIAGGGTKNATGAVQLINVAYWTVQDLHITNTAGVWNPRTARAGLMFRSTGRTRLAGLVAQRLTVDRVDSNPGIPSANRAFGGIIAQTVTHGTGFDGMVIRANRLTGVGRTGIGIFNAAYPRSSDRNPRITGNHLSRVRGDSIVMSGVDWGRIDHNVSAHGSNIATCSVKQCGRMGGPTTANAAIWPTMSSHVRIDHNEVYGEHRSAGDGSGIDVDLGTHDITVEQNYLHDNENGGVMFCGAQDTTVRFNILQNNGNNSIWFTCGWQKDQRPRNITITNNTITQPVATKWVVRNIHPFAGKNIRFTNNLVFCRGTCAYSWPNKPIASSNTFVGTRSRTEPKGAATSHKAPPLKKVGMGKVGWPSLSGYHYKRGSHPPHGVAISGKPLDIFGAQVNARRPVRGAAMS